MLTVTMMLGLLSRVPCSETALRVPGKFSIVAVNFQGNAIMENSHNKLRTDQSSQNDYGQLAIFPRCAIHHQPTVS